MLQNQIRELHRLLGKKTLEAEILKEALDATAGSKKHLLRSLSWPKDGFAMKAVCEVLGVARSNIAARARAPLAKPRPGRPALPDDEMVAGDQCHRRRHADLRLSPRLGAATPRGTGGRPACAQSQTGLSGHEGPWPAPAAPCRRHRRAPS